MKEAVPFYLRLSLLQGVISLRASMSYRWDFLLHLGFSTVWMGVSLIPYALMFHYQEEIAGYTFHSGLLVVSFFALLLSVLEGVVQPSLVEAVELFRSGRMDYLLLKPASTPFLVMTRKIQPWNATDLITGGALLLYALMKLPQFPSLLQLLSAGVLFFCGVALLYSLGVMAISLGVLLVKVDNLIYLFLSLYEVGRFPVTLFRGWARFLFTFVLPIGVMTTFPAEVLLRERFGDTLATGVGITTLFLITSHLAFRRAIRHYTSAGG